MKRFEVEIQGTTPLLQNRMSEEELFGLLGAKTTKKKAEEPLTPRELAERRAYKGDDGAFYVPTECFTSAFRHVSGDYKQKNSSRKSLRTVAGGIFRPASGTATLLDENNKPIKSFEVDLRRGTNHRTGAVALCRPRFDRWKTRMIVEIDETIVTPSVCLEILNDAGKRTGIGSYRVSSGGYFGQFSVTEWKEI